MIHEASHRYRFAKTSIPIYLAGHYPAIAGSALWSGYWFLEPLIQPAIYSLKNGELITCGYVG